MYFHSNDWLYASGTVSRLFLELFQQYKVAVNMTVIVCSTSDKIYSVCICEDNFGFVLFLFIDYEC